MEIIMKKRTLLTKLFAFTIASMLAFTACGTINEKPSEESTEEDDEEELGEIELSDSKVTIEVGEEIEVEIENFDDLKKVKIEIDDEDIADVEIDDEIITITGLSEGKATLTVSAKDCEDAELTIKVKEGEGTKPEENNGGQSGDATVETGRYIATYEITNDVWEEALGEDADYFLSFFGDKVFSLDFVMDINEGGSATLSYDGKKFVDDFMDWIDENFIDFMKNMFEQEGEAWSSEYEDIILESKDDLLEELRTSLETSMESDYNNTAELAWEIRDGKIVFIPSRDIEKACDILSDGSFILSLTSDELGYDVFGDTLDLHFCREK